MIRRLAALVLAAAATASAAPADLGEFWAATRAELAREPLEAVVTPVKAALPYKEYRVTLRGLGGVHFVSLLAIPIQGEAPAKPWPVIVTAPGYGGEQMGVMLSECQRGYAVLQVYPRGQGASEALWPLGGAEKLTWGIARPETAYYRGAYCDVIRAIDFVTTRKDLDSGRIAVIGTSQGGGIALAVTALDDRVKAVVAHVPFLCDIRAAAGMPSLVRVILDRTRHDDEAALATLDYFDPMNLVARRAVPALVSAGGKDTTCPKATVEAMFARLPGPKTLRIYPALGHTTCLAFYREMWPWLETVEATPPSLPLPAAPEGRQTRAAAR